MADRRHLGATARGGQEFRRPMRPRSPRVSCSAAPGMRPQGGVWLGRQGGNGGAGRLPTPAREERGPEGQQPPPAERAPQKQARGRGSGMALATAPGQRIPMNNALAGVLPSLPTPVPSGRAHPAPGGQPRTRPNPGRCETDRRLVLSPSPGRSPPTHRARRGPRRRWAPASRPAGRATHPSPPWARWAGRSA